MLFHKFIVSFYEQKKTKEIIAEKYVFLIEKSLNLSALFNKTSGVTLKKRDTPIIVSLASWEKRLGKAYLGIESLLRQSIKPDYIFLWLSENIESIPESLQRTRFRGVDIFLRRDIGPYKKEIYVLREHPNALLVTADDDILYPRTWLEKLYKAYLNEPNIIHCYNGNMMQFDDLGNLAPYRQWPNGKGESSFRLCPFTGCGVIYPLNSLHPDVVDENLFLKLCPSNDDLWMKFMSLIAFTGTKMVEPVAKNLYSIVGSQDVSLYKSNSQINQYVRNVSQHYEINRDFFEKHGLL